MLQHKINPIKPDLVTSYDIRPGNRGPILVLVLHRFVTYLLGVIQCKMRGGTLFRTRTDGVLACNWSSLRISGSSRDWCQM